MSFKLNLIDTKYIEQSVDSIVQYSFSNCLSSSDVSPKSVAYPGIFFEGGSTNSVEDRGERGRGSGGGSPLVRGSGGSCNLVQEISFHIVKFS